jgi:DNA ligase (NAD+)
VKIIKENSEAYYAGSPSISDAEFDEAWYELKELNPDNPVLNQIGETVFSGFVERKHRIFMHSQQKARNIEEFKTWLLKTKKITKMQSFRVDHKLDGLSLELVYENGSLVQALTQGSRTGFDIVKNVRKMQYVPENVYSPDQELFDGSLRGEIIMSSETFRKKYLTKGYKNPRAAAVGLCKKSGPHLSDIQVVLYDSDLQCQKHSQRLEHLRSIEGAKIVESKIFKSSEVLDKLEEWYVELTQNREAVDFEIDGLVVKADYINEEDGLREKPNLQIAIKFPVQNKATKILEIKWSRSGATLTPLAIIEPVELCSTTVKKVTLHNPAMVRDLKVRVGSTVRVSKRGDIIPKIEKIVKIGNGPITKIPSKCEICDEELKITETLSRLWCPNELCPALMPHRISTWLKALDVKFFGEELVQTFVRENSPQYLYEVYDLTPEVMSAWKMSGKKVGKLVAEKALRNLKNCSEGISLEIFLGGLSIPSVGTKIFSLLIGEGYSLEDLRKATSKELSEVKGIGPKRAKIIVEFLNKLSDEIDGLLNEERVILSEATSEVVNKGESVCFTGALSLPRKTYENLASKAGFSIKNTVTKGLTYLVTSDPYSGSAKNLKARALGIKVIDERSFKEMIS